jgi:endonuclease/exonuclease/phosphatase family metal-dependent hydrolase
MASDAKNPSDRSQRDDELFQVITTYQRVIYDFLRTRWPNGPWAVFVSVLGSLVTAFVILTLDVRIRPSISLERSEPARTEIAELRESLSRLSARIETLNSHDNDSATRLTTRIDQLSTQFATRPLVVNVPCAEKLETTDDLDKPAKQLAGFDRMRGPPILPPRQSGFQDGSAQRFSTRASTSHAVPLPKHDRLKIAFWNLRDLSLKSRNDAERRKICQIITEQNFDVVAICEVNDEGILAELASILEESGDRWKSVTSEKVGNSGPSSEYYGVLYNDDVLEFQEAWQLPKKKLRDLGIGSDLSVPSTLSFDRNPYAVILATDDGKFDVALLIVHVTWGKSVEPRVAEVRALASYYKEVFAKEHDVLVGGDFNRNVGDQRSVVWLSDAAKVLDTTSATPATVIQGPSTYDHIMLNPTYTTQYHNVHGVVDFDQTMFHGNLPQAKKAISDHRPVWIEVTVP